MFGNPAAGHFLNAPVDDLTFTLAKAELAVLDVPAWNLFWDFDIILGMAKVFRFLFFFLILVHLLTVLRT
jgi:hypothetical protein